MQKARRRIPWPGVLWLVLSASAGGCRHDIVWFDNRNPGDDIGLLLDGNRYGTEVDDCTFTTPSYVIDVGVVEAGASNEIIVFQKDRPVQLQTVGWTFKPENVRVDMGSALGLSFTVWILAGDYRNMRFKAAAAYLRTANIWWCERLGTRIIEWDVRNATDDPDAAALLDIKGDVQEFRDLKNLIGFTPGRINIYYAERVDVGGALTAENGTIGYLNNGGLSGTEDRFVIVGSNASDHLVTHEIGHHLGLSHVNQADPGNLAMHFDSTNVMHDASDDRHFLTEGQTYRAHLRWDSSINGIYGLRPGLPLREECLHVTRMVSCPGIQKRIWEDGSQWPPN